MPSSGANWKKFFYSPWFLGVIVVAVLALLFGYGRAFFQDYQVGQEISHLQDEARNLEAKKLESLDILKYVKSQSFVEEKARTQLNMAKDGEQVAIITASRTKNGDGQGKNNMLELGQVSNPGKWWNYFFEDKN